ncbi:MULTISPECIES: helix-turn-helix transcriptional regulator [unclassified Adlercreutzia]|uniref:helix-turn-helix transcriptional regulator n=1 Tax=unclassified Adlercreutzia TaxID=2636013 RepID=UPI00197F3726|nr:MULTISPECIES: helix-turn-helix domain-containing protein [unclassified Adlercreutzia]
MIYSSDIAERVRLGRRELGLTQSALAQEARVSRPTIARIEAGGADSVSLGTILRVLNATNWDLSIERGVAPRATEDEFDMDTYLDSLYGDAR